MYPWTKVYLIWQTSDFVGPNFPKENMNDKNFEKINIKIKISIYMVIYLCTKFQSV